MLLSLRVQPFKRADELPFDVIREEVAAMTPDDFIRVYEEARAKGGC